MRAIDVEIAVVNLFGHRRTVMVPNVYWGLGLRHEADLICLDPQGRFTEVEIKVSKSDLKADLRKTHNHWSSIISRLVYAMPEELIPVAKQILPRHAGLISVQYQPAGKTTLKMPVAYWVRISKHNSLRPSQNQIQDFMRLGCMRIWSLKQHYYQNHYRQRNP